MDLHIYLIIFIYEHNYTLLQRPETVPYKPYLCIKCWRAEILPFWQKIQSEHVWARKPC